MSAIRYSFVASVVVVAMLTACGDEVTEMTNVNASLDIVEKYKELPKCEESVYGSLIYVEDSSQVFACTSDGWVSLKGEKGAKGDEGKAGENGKNGEDGKDGSSCSATKLKDGSGIEVKCNGKLVGTITNGENGKDGESCTTKAVEGGVEVSCPGSEPVVIKNGDKGANGKSAYELSGTDKTLEEWLASLKGKDGESCTTKAVEGGVEVSCPGSEPVVIKNGTNGENGTSCNIVSDKDGVITIQCGEGENAKTAELYKAVCGAKPFDPETQFCAKFNDDAKMEQVYKMVTIAPEGKDYSETWMAENLNYKTENSWCYDDKDENCAKYGRLYTWAAAVGKTETECGSGQECNLGTGDIRGVCPEGWHLPSQEEWEDLFKAVGGQSTAGTKLKSKTGWMEYSGINNEDAFGFSALPAGRRYSVGNYYYEGYYAEFWSSTKVDGIYAYQMYLGYEDEYAYLYDTYKFYGFSVRCLKD